jgi:RimJ/RimL family protein N-acetyltransferase
MSAAYDLINMQSDFVTQRLVLSSLTVDRQEFILELVNTPGWLRFIGDRKILTPGDARAYIDKINQSQIFKYWVAELKNEKIPIGIVTFIKRDYLEFYDIGFAFLPAYSKTGYALEATAEVLNYLSREHLVDHLLATTVTDNTNSIRLLKKLGFELEREIEVEGEDLLVYGLLLTPAG